MRREIRAEGAVNLRDIGGYPTGAGARVRWRRVLRSGHFGDLSADGRKAVVELGVRTVLDLRDAWERDAVPSDWWFEHGADVVQVWREMGGGFDIRKLLHFSRAQTLEEARAQRVRAYRLKPLYFAPALRCLFRVLADGASYPIVFHCMTGKDRTGFVAAVLLSWLGVDRETVVGDYMLSGRIVGRLSRERWRHLIRLYELDRVDAIGLRALSEVRREYIQASLERIDEEFGGLEAYLAEYVGARVGELAAARELLLET